MSNRSAKVLLSCLALMLMASFTRVQAANDTEDGVLDPNSAIVQAELYIWNRISDLLDVFRGGVGLGPGLGAEVAITNYLQLGAYASLEKGMAFPHCLPPLWLVDYYEQNENAFVFHGGSYATAAFGPFRAETEPVDEATRYPHHFARDTWDVRAQADIVLVHLYLAIRPLEIADFFTGIVCYDLTKDDMRLDPTQERRPADQFGRSICNILFGVLEVPLTILNVTQMEGDFQGASKGVGLGLWHFVVREIVGVVEFVTFPFGWDPIIEPAYVWDSDIRSVTWKVYAPSFHRRY